MQIPYSVGSRSPEDLMIECEASSALGSLLQDLETSGRQRSAHLQIVAKKQSPTVRELVALALAAAGLFEAGPKSVTVAGFFAAIMFAASGVTDLKVLSGWKIDGLIDLMKYDSDREVFLLKKSDLQVFQEQQNIDDNFIEWLVEAGALIDERANFRVSKLFKKGNILNII